MGYVPKTETERALQESLREMELQCKERVDVLEALEQSRKQAEKEARKAAKEEKALRKAADRNPSLTNISNVNNAAGGWIGEGTIPPVNYEDLARPPPLPTRSSPSMTRGGSTESLVKPRNNSTTPVNSSPSPLPAIPTLPVPKPKPSRSPSPENRKRMMLTTLRAGNGKQKISSRAGSKKPPAASKAAGLAWDHTPRPSLTPEPPHKPNRSSLEVPNSTAIPSRKSLDDLRSTSDDDHKRTKSSNPSDYIPSSSWREPHAPTTSALDSQIRELNIAEGAESPGSHARPSEGEHGKDTPPPPPPHDPLPKSTVKPKPPPPRLSGKPPDLTYRREYPPATLKPGATSIGVKPLSSRTDSHVPGESSGHIRRRPIANSSTPRGDRPNVYTSTSSGSEENVKSTSRSSETPRRRVPRQNSRTKPPAKATTPPSSDDSSRDDSSPPTPQQMWEARVKVIMKDLPRGVDEAAARQILNDIVVQGDEVHWSDIAGLEIAKKALKEAVVYPFLRPDLFMGLREPARGMLLFGPPGTGKTMLARAVATESKSTFFAISASSLTSKWHGDSEKLVRALFALAKKLAPSIIFVDEIDSLLSARSSSSEHEASRRSKTEFLIQWSDLQRAAAGRDTTKDKEGDPSRVLVLAATNVPWDIDEAARRRFVRRQYIPLPESETRATQIKTLLSHQKHDLTDEDIEVLVQVTEG